MEEFWPLPTDDQEGRKKRDETEGERLEAKLKQFDKYYNNK
jgi:hypothetical protein